MANSETHSRVLPLLVRQGARYTCFGDGLCCTDAHGLGPLTEDEVQSLTRISLDVVIGPEETDFDDPMLRTNNHGRCVFLGRTRCELHASLGPEIKPEGCRKFPYMLTATPDGGRVRTSHRCPCRTVGERPDLDLRDAEGSLRAGTSELSPDYEIEDEIDLGDETVSFAEWRARESEMISKLLSGEDPATVVQIDPFFELEDTTWRAAAKAMLEDADDSRFGAALRWFAEAILAEVSGRKPKFEARPWADAFDRSVARVRKPREARLVIADWVADELWGLEWAALGDFELFQQDVGTRYVLARRIAKRLELLGLNSEQAGAEAVTVVELVGESDHWTDLMGTS